MNGTTVGRRALAAGAEELRELMARSRDVVALAVLVGGITGVLVAGLERLVVEQMLSRVQHASLLWLAVLPGLGLVATAVALHRLGGRGSPATADEYVKSMHRGDAELDVRPVPARTLGAIATLGAGGSAGLEGPSIYLGSAVGIVVYERIRRVLSGVDRRAAIVAGAAAGVAAIFKAPATGAVFALEVPYQEDLARHSLLPAMVGSAAGYSAFVAINGTEPLIPVAGHPALNLADLAMALAIGLACGFGARVFAWVMNGAKDLRDRLPVLVRVGVGALGLVALAVGSAAWFDRGALALGPGYGSIRYALDPERGLWILALLATVRVFATASTITGGGVAGMFVPLVVQGALTGRLMAGLFHTDQQSLCVVVGIAAFLGAGYRVPLAAVMFVAEATGRPGFVVPGLIAATVSQLLMGDATVCRYQRTRRLGYLEERSRVAISTLLGEPPPSLPPDTSLAAFVSDRVAAGTGPVAPIVRADGTYGGLVVLDDVLAVPHVEWSDRTVGEVARTELPVAGPDWSMGQALRVMTDAEVDHLPVLGADRRLLGVLTSDTLIDRARVMETLDIHG